MIKVDKVVCMKRTAIHQTEVLCIVQIFLQKGKTKSSDKFKKLKHYVKKSKQLRKMEIDKNSGKLIKKRTQKDVL